MFFLHHHQKNLTNQNQLIIPFLHYLIINFDYGKLRDLNIMAFIGFGLLHSILKKNSWTSISLNSLLLAISIQISLFFNFVWKMAFKEKWVGEDMDIYFINKAIFISCSISITYGCVLGKLSFIQLRFGVIYSNKHCASICAVSKF